MAIDKRGASGSDTKTWMPSKEEIDTLAASPRPDWAWTFLRRNSHYRAVALRNRELWLATDTAVQEPLIYQSIARHFAAEEWGLRTFR